MEQDEFLTRIIPTRVGTRVLTTHDVKSLRDHPHAYGDKCKVCRIVCE